LTCEHSSYYFSFFTFIGFGFSICASCGPCCDCDFCKLTQISNKETHHPPLAFCCDLGTGCASGCGDRASDCANGGAASDCDCASAGALLRPLLLREIRRILLLLRRRDPCLQHDE
jgi:hypothetical protein